MFNGSLNLNVEIPKIEVSADVNLDAGANAELESDNRNEAQAGVNSNYHANVEGNANANYNARVDLNANSNANLNSNMYNEMNFNQHGNDNINVEINTQVNPKVNVEADFEADNNKGKKVRASDKAKSNKKNFEVNVDHTSNTMGGGAEMKSDVKVINQNSSSNAFIEIELKDREKNLDLEKRTNFGSGGNLEASGHIEVKKNISKKNSKKAIIEVEPSISSKINLTGSFKLNVDQITDFYTAVERVHKPDEDIEAIDNFGGVDSIVSALRSHKKDGITESDFSERIKIFGENKLPREEIPHCCEFVLDAFGDLMIRILTASAIFQLIVGTIPQIQHTELDFVEGVSIAFAVVLVVSVGSVVNYTKELSFRELNDRNDNLIEYNVRRGKDTVKSLKTEELLAGDVIELRVGDIFPVDGLLIEGNDVKIDESSLTGETDLVEKETIEVCKERKIEELEQSGGKALKKHSVPSPFLLSGTRVEEGSGWYISMRVGGNSKSGKIRMDIDAQKSKKKELKSGDDKEKEKDVDKEKKNDEHKEADEEAEEGEEGEEGDDETKTPLELKLDSLAEDVTWFGVASACATFIALIIRLIVNQVTLSAEYSKTEQISYRNSWYNSTLLGEASKKIEAFEAIKLLIELIRIIILVIAIIVVAIPEGLPLAVTLSLAVSIRKMEQVNNLVRKMNACETMGGANYICTDKTGTLTTNEMSVDKFYNCHSSIEFKDLVEKKKIKKEGTEDFEKVLQNFKEPIEFFKQDYFEIIKQSLVLNNDGTFNGDDSILKASKTDLAFIDFLHCLKVNFNNEKKKFYPPIGDDHKKKRFPFTSKRKKMSTIVDHDSFLTGSRIFSKGASEIILNSCSYYLNPLTAQKEILSDEKKQVFLTEIKSMAQATLRTVCISYKDLTPEQNHNWKDKKPDSGENLIELEEFCLIGIIGIKDKLKPQVDQAVLQCQRAGIKVIMVTGDNIDTAKAIAVECNIATQEDIEENSNKFCVEGPAFYKSFGGMKCDSCGSMLEKCNCPRTDAELELKQKNEGVDNLKKRKERIVNQEKFNEATANLKVVARSRSDDKYTLVYGLRRQNYVVAVTGDGTNDAQALSQADVGFAMGIAGTDIAKEAADIIILDDDFNSIVQAVLWGRNIYDNIRKFVQFQLSVNISACLIVFLCSCIGNETPLTAIQMLWLNLIMDSLGSLALATEPPTPDLLERPPTKRDEYIISPLMWKHIIGQSIIQLILLLVLYIHGHKFIPETNPEAIKLAKRIYECYGILPGQDENTKPDYDKVLAGPSLFWSSKIYISSEATPIQCGDLFKKENLLEAQHYFISKYGSAHITVIFNMFVFYTLFNQINVRKIDGSYNIFINMHKNYIYIIILIIEGFLQTIIVQVTGIVFRVSIWGLDGHQWGICIGFSCITFIVSLILKPIPIERLFEKLEKCIAEKKNKDSDKKEEEAGLGKDEGQVLAKGEVKALASGNAGVNFHANIDIEAKADFGVHKDEHHKKDPSHVIFFIFYLIA
jgi:Ca2+ transporting ATPase